ncbi:sensor histidine kinase [Arenibaculum pallidiluteum]|uniref:sensor histidine kinase n=1 Tax=Arenibaculum pallidiluteum TaxID=2812559 RepID=UPI001A96F566|nr:PAS domain-containing protein [Arenibaculum pallidiluteum]
MAETRLPETTVENILEFYDEAPCGLLSTRPDGTIVAANDTLLAWTGRRRDQVLQRIRIQELLSIAGRVFWDKHLFPMLRMQGQMHEVALDLLEPEGRRIPVLLTGAAKLDADGAPVLFRFTILDATERRQFERDLLRARARAERSAESKAELVHMVGHDIRSALNGILGGAALLADTDLSDEQQEFLRFVQQAARTLLDLSDNVLRAGRIEAGGLVPEEREFDLRELVARSCDLLRPRAEEKGLSLTAETDPAIPDRLIGDPVKLGQVLGNLLGNAVKFTRVGSVRAEAWLAADLCDSVLLDFRVSDTGIGIAAERLHRIFEAFTQESYETGLEHGGAGLGLAICQRLLGLYGSRLEVESEPGRGTTFGFRLRLMKA